MSARRPPAPALVSGREDRGPVHLGPPPFWLVWSIQHVRYMRELHHDRALTLEQSRHHQLIWWAARVDRIQPPRSAACLPLQRRLANCLAARRVLSPIARPPEPRPPFPRSTARGALRERSPSLARHKPTRELARRQLRAAAFWRSHPPSPGQRRLAPQPIALADVGLHHRVCKELVTRVSESSCLGRPGGPRHARDREASQAHGPGEEEQER